MNPGPTPLSSASRCPVDNGTSTLVTYPEPVTSSAGLRGLIVDWGGVLTAPLDSAMTQWAASEGVEHIQVDSRQKVEGALEIAGVALGTGRRQQTL